MTTALLLAGAAAFEAMIVIAHKRHNNDDGAFMAKALGVAFAIGALIALAYAIV